MSQEELQLLYKRVQHVRISMLFEEPCPLYEPDCDDDGTGQGLDRDGNP